MIIVLISFAYENWGIVSNSVILLVEVEMRNEGLGVSERYFINSV